MSDVMLSELKNFMKNDAGKGYRSVKKIEDAVQKKDMEELRTRTDKAIELFDSLLDKVGYETNMVSLYHKQFLDGTKTKIRSYFWGELRLEEALNSPESISLFLEKDCNDDVLIRISLEVSEKHISDVLLEKHNKLILESSLEGFYYAVNKTGNKDLHFTSNIGEAKMLIQNEEFCKIQLCKIVRVDSIAEEDLLSELVQSVNDLMPIYKKLCK